MTDAQTYDLLPRNTTTVWLRARPRDHWNRVVAQGDRRPMADRRGAMQEFEALLVERGPLYARSDFAVDTSVLDVGAAVEQIATALARS